MRTFATILSLGMAVLLGCGFLNGVENSPERDAVSSVGRSAVRRREVFG